MEHKFDKDMYSQTSGIFSEIVGRKILPLFDARNEFQTDGTEIYMPEQYESPYDDWSAMYTQFEHELGHIVFDTDTELLNYYAHKQPGAWSRGGRILLDILEDERIESLWGAVYPGSNKRFKKLKEKFMLHVNPKLLKKAPMSPEMLIAQAMLISLGGQPQNKFQKFIKGCLDEVKWKDFTATVLLWKRMMKVFQKLFPQMESQQQSTGNNMVSSPDQEWDEKALKDIPKMSGDSEQGDGNKQQKQDGQKQNGQNGDRKEGDGGNQRENDRKDGQAPNKKPETEVGKCSKAKTPYEAKRELEGWLKILADARSKSKYKMQNRRALQTIERSVAATKADTSMLEKSAERAQKKINEIVSKLISAPQSFHGIRNDAEPHPHCNMLYGSNFNMAEVRGIANLIRRPLLKMGRIGDALGDEGIEIDIPAYIQHKLGQGDGEVFIGEHEKIGMLVTCIIDMSGSMNGEKSVRACKVSAIMMLALEGVAKFESFIYYSGNKDCNLFQCDMEDLRKLSASGGLTPTPLAVEFALKHGKRNSRYSRKMVLLVTDGYPTLSGRTEHPEELTRITVDKVKRQRVAFHAINLLGKGEADEDRLEFMYGRKHYSVIDTENLETTVMKKVMEQVVQTVKMSI